MASVDNPQRALNSLNTFLVENPELERLNARLSAFNIFQVLRVGQVEIRHSNVLSWLLNPSETHGLGVLFLRRFLSRVLLEHDFPEVTLSAAQVELMSLGDVEIRREWENIDLVVIARTAGWCLLIENKIRSKESPGQLLRYLTSIKKEFSDLQIIPVYLTLEGELPSEIGSQVGYVPVSHINVLQIAEQFFEQHESRIPDDANVFIRHYLATLKRLTMQDTELANLCKEIYRKHREAIDLIVAYGASSQVLETCENTLRDLEECEFIENRGSLLFFMPKALGRVLPGQELNGWNGLPRKVPVCCWLNNPRTGKIRAVLEVGPVANSELRIRLLKALLAAGFPVKNSALRPTSKFTRIASYTQKLREDETANPDESEQYISEVTTTLWKKLKPEVQKLEQALRSFSWQSATEK